MRRIIAISLFFCFLASPVLKGQRWQPQDSRTESNLRGISAVSRKVAWASGSAGAWLRTINGGLTWTSGVVPGADDLDFRDVVAFDEKSAILMSAGPGAKSRVYRTEDGGATWKLLFQNPDPAGFWDCMAFWDKQHGVMLGDPVGDSDNSKNFQLYLTEDAGQHWYASPAGALAGEAAFAASGTCVAVHGQYRRVQNPGEWYIRASAWFATGGNAARVFRSKDAGATWTAVPVPIAQGASSKGIFSIAIRDSDFAIVVGGDYQQPALAERNVAFTEDGGATWREISGRPPRGYRSAVAFVPGHDLVVAVGTSGSDYSRDSGRSWLPIDNENYNAVSFAPDGSGWAVGPKGKITRWERVERGNESSQNESAQ